MTTYRWNQAETAAAYDRSAELVHPHYIAIQDAILDLLPQQPDAEFLLVDLGGGSGRLVERFLERFSRATAMVIDQSESFLDLARRRLQRFSERASCHLSRLQEDWQPLLPGPAAAIVSMSAIHHLDGSEKRDLYARCYQALLPGGVLLNGDEVRAESEDEYRRHVESWAAHMRRLVNGEQVPPAMADALLGWIERNVNQFGGPRRSGDDCHETIAAQLDYFRQAGFHTVDAPWRRDLWAVLRGGK